MTSALRQTSLLKLITLSSIGSLLEFYDFAIYAFFSHEIAINFFPASDKLSSLIETFGVFAIGYLARPIGGIIFSHLGDKFGRKKNFTLSILIMAVATLCMGLVPSYAHIGEAASAIFIILRLLQGLSLGAETPGAITYVAESVTQRQGLWCGLIFALMNLGAVLAVAMHALMNHYFSRQGLMTWGFRIPFILGGVLGFIGWQIRKNMTESFAFKKQQWKPDIPLVALLQFYPLKLLAAILIAILGGTSVSLVYLYMPSYLQNVLHYHYNIINLNLAIGLIIYTVMTIVFAYLSDRFSRKKLIGLAAILLFVLAYPAYDMLRLNHHPVLPLVFVIFGVTTAMLMGTLPSLFARLFVTQVRYTGVALSYNFGISITAGLMPMLATIFIKYTNPTFAPTVLLMVAALIGLMGVLLIPRGFLNKPH